MTTIASDVERTELGEGGSGNPRESSKWLSEKRLRIIHEPLVPGRGWISTSMAAKAHARAAARTGRTGWGMGWVEKVDFTYFSLPYKHTYPSAHIQIYFDRIQARVACTWACNTHIQTRIHIHTHIQARARAHTRVHIQGMHRATNSNSWEGRSARG